MTEAAYIYDAIRTPRGRGKRDGALYEVKPVALGACLLGELQHRHDLDTARVDDVILGCVAPEGEQGGDIAKSVVQFAQWDESVPGVQLDRFCASGLEAVNIAAAKVAAGWAQLIVAGGLQSMSRSGLNDVKAGPWMDDMETNFLSKSSPQGVGADFIASMEGWTRADVDAYALASQQRAAHAWSQGYFDKSIVPVKDINGITILARDEHLRLDTTMAGLGALKPAFETLGKAGFDELVLSKYTSVERIHHVHTAGNSSGIVDGAGAVLIGSMRIGKELNLQPRARIVSTAVTSSDPTVMLLGPGPAANKCLALAKLRVRDIDLFEINEAFASVAMRFMKELGISPEIVNVNGGAIALGHPLGATGAMLVGTVLDELERRGLRRGLIALCAGGGQGIATIVERV